MISFPLGLDAFFAGLPVSSCSFRLPESLQIEETGGGEIIAADLGTRLWEGEVTLAADYHDALAGAEAVLSVLRDAGASFLAFPLHKPGPALDPYGFILGESVPLIASLPTARSLILSGLPAGYVLSPGDYMAFGYGAAPARMALHQFVTGGQADSSGLTPQLAVTPAIRPGAAIGAAVQLIRPALRARYVPGSYRSAGYSKMIGQGPSFAFRQTLRA